MSNNIIKKDFTMEVSIGDASKAVIALRKYGLTELEAAEIINEESGIAFYEHNIIPKNALSPELLEMFGHQHVKHALSDAYSYIEDYGLDWMTYKNILSKLLTVYKPEELISGEEKIQYFLDKMLELLKTPTTIERFEGLGYSENHKLSLLLFDLGYDDIISMCENPFDKEIEEMEGITEDYDED